MQPYPGFSDDLKYLVDEYNKALRIQELFWNCGFFNDGTEYAEKALKYSQKLDLIVEKIYGIKK